MLVCGHSELKKYAQDQWRSKPITFELEPDQSIKTRLSAFSLQLQYPEWACSTDVTS